MIKIASTIAAVATTLVLASPASALQSCELKIDGDQIEFAGRGQPFYDKKVNKWDDGDTCRSQGRKYGPNECRVHDGSTYLIKAVRNNGNVKDWEYDCP